MEKFKTQIPIRYGIIAAVAMFTIGMLMYVFYQSVLGSFLFSATVGILTFGILLFLAIWSGISYRRENGGVISFSHAFLAVYIVLLFSAVASTGSQLLINKVIDTQYATKASSLLKEKMTDYFDKHNVPEESAAEALKGMGPEKFDPPMVEVAKTFVIYLGVWAVIAAIIAAFIKRGSSDLISSDLPPEPIRTI